MARVELDGGRLDQAVACAESAEAAAAGLAAAVGDGRRTARPRPRAARTRAAGRRRGAGARSAATAEAAGAPVEAARSRLLAGMALAAAGDRERAVALLRSAERDLDERGALRDRGEARRQMRQLGARTEPRGPSGAAGGGIESLSRREHEVATLVTARKTNKEVAAELFLSEKTVESHLRNIFAKLGASSRVDVARAVERGSGVR